MRKKSDKLNKILKKKNKIYLSGIKTLKNAPTDKNALSPLGDLSRKLKKNNNFSLINYEGSAKNIKATFKADTQRDYKTALGHLKNLGFEKLKIDEDKSAKVLKLTFLNF